MDEKQTFRSFDLFSLIFLVGVSLSLVGAILHDNFADRSRSVAMYQAEAMAHQLLPRGVQFMQKIPPQTERIPASVDALNAGRKERVWSSSSQGFAGKIGQDPWGHPFHYQVVSPSKSINYLVVWSDGPNRKADTSPDNLVQMTTELSRHFYLRRQPNFHGDDVGYLLKLAPPENE